MDEANDNNEKSYVKKITTNKMASNFEKYKSLTSSQYQREIQRFPNRVGLFDMREIGLLTDYEGYPSGSLF